MEKITDWEKILSKEEYRVLRLKGTEAPFSGEYDNFYEAGIYLCRGCGSQLFSSEDKFKSGTGWPSFRKPIKEENVTLEEDRSLGMIRTEAICSLCEGHLGHYFPEDTRYCMNSLSLEFIPQEEIEKVEEIPLNYSKEEIALISSVLDQEGILYSIQNEDLQDLFGAGRLGTGINCLVGEIKISVNRKDYKIVNYLINKII